MRIITNLTILKTSIFLVHDSHKVICNATKARGKVAGLTGFCIIKFIKSIICTAFGTLIVDS